MGSAPEQDWRGPNVKDPSKGVEGNSPRGARGEKGVHRSLAQPGVTDDGSVPGHTECMSREGEDREPEPEPRSPHPVAHVLSLPMKGGGRCLLQLICDLEKLTKIEHELPEYG